VLPAILYPLLLGAGYLIFDLFDVQLAEKPSDMQTTEYLNPELPQAQLNSDGIGGKYENMAKSYGKIQDYSAVLRTSTATTQSKQKTTIQNIRMPTSHSSIRRRRNVCKSCKTSSMQVVDVVKQWAATQ
jgi:hypothetical protein